MPNDNVGAEPLRPHAAGHDAEVQRSTAEETRIAAESARHEAEKRRESAEAARAAAEEARIAAERLRDEALAAVRATSDTLITALEHMKAVEEMRRHRDRLDGKNKDSH
jgi:ribosome recycling factor